MAASTSLEQHLSRRGPCQRRPSHVSRAASSWGQKWYEMTTDPCERVHLGSAVKRHYAYSAATWKRHKAPDRYLRHFLRFGSSSVLQRLSVALAVLGLVALLVVLAQHYPLLPGQSFVLPLDPFNLSATALSLLLALRVSESYGRFRSAHQGLAAMEARLRETMRLLSAGLQHWPNRAAVLDVLATKVLVFQEVIAWHLRGEPPEMLTRKLVRLGLREAACAELLATGHAPSAILAEVSSAIYALQAQGNLDALICTAIDGNLADLNNHLAACEQIQRNPMSIPYTRHTSRVLWIWLLLLPLALVKELDVMVVPAVVALGFGLLGIEDIAVQIEEPFTVIDIEDYSMRLRRSVTVFRQAPAPGGGGAAAMPDPGGRQASAGSWRLRGALRRLRARRSRRAEGAEVSGTSGLPGFTT